MGPGEGSFDELAARYGANHRLLEDLGPELRPLRDLRAIAGLMRIVRAYRPDIVHTHTAKAGLAPEPDTAYAQSLPSTHRCG